MNSAIFITATDTDAGKSYFSELLVRALVKADKRVAVFKPVSAGCQVIDGVLVNDDALRLMNAANSQQPLSEINPIAFKEAIAPHIAAKYQAEQLSVARIGEHWHTVLQRQADVIITEGAGGWRLPLGNGEYLSAFAQQSQQQVILVVNMKLGCLNHSMLTYQAIVADGLNCIGWVANCQMPMAYLNDNIDELKSLLPVPLIAQLDFQPDVAQQLANIDLNAVCG